MVLQQSLEGYIVLLAGSTPAAVSAVHRLGDGGHLNSGDDDDIVGLAMLRS